MAVILNISDGTTTVNFQNDTGPELADRYLPVFATPTGDGTIPADVTEAVPVLIRITSDNNLASTLQDIARLQWQAERYMANPTVEDPVWFYRKLTGETGGGSAGIRFLVKSISFTPNAHFGGMFDVGPAITDGRVGVVSITHHAYGEAPAALAAAGTNNVSVLGGAADYSGTDVVGDVPARLYYLGLDGLAAARVYRQYWLGFRSDNNGVTPANVVTLWEAEDGTVGLNGTFTNDPTASPGGGGNNELTCSFATETWASRLSINLADVTANYDDMTGEFVVLMRAKVDANTAQVKLQQTAGAGDVYRFGPVVDVADTAWNIYNLGVCSFPMRDLHAVPIAMYAASYDQRNTLHVWGRVKPGGSAPSLSIDCLVLIPCDEYFIHVQSATTSGVAAATRVSVAPEDTPTAITIDTSGPYFQLSCPVSTIGAGVPTGDGRVFICAANDNDGTAPAFDDDLDAEVSVIPRWVYFRGAE